MVVLSGVTEIRKIRKSLIVSMAEGERYSPLKTTTITAPTTTANPSAFIFQRGRETAVVLGDALVFFGL